MNCFKTGLMVAAACGVSSAASADLMITGVLDGTLPGGEPKVVELYATSDIADLSTYAVSRGGNGAAFDSITAGYILPSIALSAGDFYYAVGNSFVDQTAVFDSVFPSLSGSRALNFGANSNGDDVTGVFFDATGVFTGGEALVDVFGELGVDGTGEAWEHLDGWAYSKDGRTASTTFTVSDWTYSGPNALDGADAAAIAASFPEGTFVIPEPGSLALLGLGGLLIARRRRA